MKLCEHCIEEIRSKGEQIYVDYLSVEEGKCEFCKEEDVEVYECSLNIL